MDQKNLDPISDMNESLARLRRMQEEISWKHQQEKSDFINDFHKIMESNNNFIKQIKSVNNQFGNNDMFSTSQYRSSPMRANLMKGVETSSVELNYSP